MTKPAAAALRSSSNVLPEFKATGIPDSLPPRWMKVARLRIVMAPLLVMLPPLLLKVSGLVKPPTVRLPLAATVTAPLLVVVVDPPPPPSWSVGPPMSTVPAAAFATFNRQYRFPPVPATVLRWPLLVRVTPAQHRML